MYINHKRIQKERCEYRDRDDAPYGDCGTLALAAVAHVTYDTAMAYLRGHKYIAPKLLNSEFYGWRFERVKKAKAKNATEFAVKHPDGRYILYCGGKHAHHYVPCVHGEVWNHSDYYQVTDAYLACPI